VFPRDFLHTAAGPAGSLLSVASQIQERKVRRQET
jgi:hypothetical protein